jgi:hypothetical protein
LSSEEDLFRFPMISGISARMVSSVAPSPVTAAGKFPLISYKKSFYLTAWLCIPGIATT